ncbi:MAG: hypothetical protein SGI83_13735 [Bacteroidota bacterium]|nr:hypothetical protein [Bacteroidota bacterium]
MAKLQDNLFTGCIGNVCVYRMNGHSYLRSKSSLSRKRVLKDRAFEKTGNMPATWARLHRFVQ